MKTFFAGPGRRMGRFIRAGLIGASLLASVDASAILAVPSAYSGSQSFGNGGAVNYDVFTMPGNYGDLLAPNFVYFFALGGTGSISQLDIPLLSQSSILQGSVTGPAGWSHSFVNDTSPNWNWSYAAGTSANGKMAFNTILNELVFTGPSLALSSAPLFGFSSTYAPIGAPYQLVTNSGTVFADPPVPNAPSAVPEPGSLTLVGIGALLLGLVVNRKNRYTHLKPEKFPFCSPLS